MKSHYLIFLVLAAVAKNAGCQQSPLSPGDVSRIETAKIFSNPSMRKLTIAAETGDVATIGSLVKQGVDVNGVGRYNVTPLYRCLIAQNKVGYLELLKCGANPNIRHERGLAVMHEAATIPDPFFLEMALKFGGDPDLPDTGNPFTKDLTPLFYAVSECNASNVKLLVAAGANVNYTEKGRNDFPLYRAFHRPSYEIVYLLLNAGADPLQKRGVDEKNLIEWVDKLNENDLDEAERPWFRKVKELLERMG